MGMRPFMSILIVLLLAADALAVQSTTRAPHPGGQWTGDSVAFFRMCAESANLRYQLVPFDTMHATIEAVQNHTIDLVATGLSVTPERESYMDFTRSFAQSGVSIVVRVDRAPPLLTIARQVKDSHLPRMMCALLVISLLMAMLVAWIERRKNPEQFGGSWMESLGQSLWWSVTTMTTVGYGDRVPKSFIGRLIGVMWTLLAFVLMTVLAGVIASELTISRFLPMFRSIDQVRSLVCGVVSDAAAETVARERGLNLQAFPDIETMLASLENRKVDAAVVDTASMRGFMHQGLYRDLAMLPDALEVNFIAFGAREGLPTDVMNTLNYWILRCAQSSKFQNWNQSNLADIP